MLNIKLYKSILRWLLVIFIMAVIFSFSAQSGEASRHQSDIVAEGILRLFQSDGAFGDIGITILRKAAHFSAYLILGVSVFWAVSAYKIRKTRVLLWSLLICLIYAASDEIHQAFVPERSPEFLDVCIDFCGALCGNAIMLLHCRKGKSQKR